ncbi:MAG: nuclear transport factor 2 family protein [Nocardioidaceae bacterium]|nr:nuclear transport factor 2 family protein [Nocardioidaceae bacterium]
MEMSERGDRRPANQPADLGRFFVERANGGDVEGLVALYEPDAVLALPTGEVAAGSAAIGEAYERLLGERPTFSAGDQALPLVNGELALTSTRITGGATVEVARRQSDGTWLWAIDQPSILG